jgi:hypothetical protein
MDQDIKKDKITWTDDAVNHPKHYNMGKIEVAEFIEDQRLGFHLGNVVKYICRAGFKEKSVSSSIKDFEKAVWYLRREIELRKAHLDNREPCRPNEMTEDSKTEKFTREFNQQTEIFIEAMLADKSLMFQEGFEALEHIHMGDVVTVERNTGKVFRRRQKGSG